MTTGFNICCQYYSNYGNLESSLHRQNNEKVIKVQQCIRKLKHNKNLSLHHYYKALLLFTTTIITFGVAAAIYNIKVGKEHLPLHLNI